MSGRIKKLNLESGHYCVNAEIYYSFTDMLNDLRTRKITDNRFYNMQSSRLLPEWHGVSKYKQALKLLEEGYTPAVNKIYDEICMKNGRKISGTNRGLVTENSVVGYQPIVPLALYGIPNNMIMRKPERKESRVFNLLVDTTCVGSTPKKELIRYGIKLIRMIYNLEMSGHKINLYICEAFAGQVSADLLCIKVKNSNTPLDLRRISFPLCHPAFTRVICFDWYSKFPLGAYRKDYGTTMVNALGRSKAESLINRLFGPSSVYITYKEIETGRESYLMKVFGIEKIA